MITSAWWSALRRIVHLGLVALLLIWMLGPFLWAISSSLKNPSELFASPVIYLPSTPYVHNYTDLFARGNAFPRNILNSVVVAGLSTLLALACGALAAFALARRRFRGRGLVMLAILAVSMFPQISILSGMYLLIQSLGLYNSWCGLMLSYSILTLPLTVWILTSFVAQVPGSLEEAAVMDGATPLQTLWHVFLPVMGPGLVTAGLLAFIQAWNEFLFALTFTSSDTARTVPVAIALFSGASARELPWGQIMAASVVVTIPLIVLVVIFQRRIVEGLTAGAVKG
jgi:trehalose/maltose transport system permease protein